MARKPTFTIVDVESASIARGCGALLESAWNGWLSFSREFLERIAVEVDSQPRRGWDGQVSFLV